jgi:plasmid maintenance system antidote protein VapI
MSLATTAAMMTATTALILACAFGNSPDFWLNVRRRSDLWKAMHSPRERKRIERAQPLTAGAQAYAVIMCFD